MKKLYLRCVRPAQILVFGLILGQFMSEPAQAMETGTFEPPSLDGYVFVEEKHLDKNEKMDGIRETRLEKYQSRNGERIGKYVTGGKTWAWAVAPNRVDVCRYPDNYAIRDSDGDGVFDERYRYCGEEFWLPQFLSGPHPPPEMKR